MDKRNWLWKRKSGEKSPGETESSESISSHSERNSDDQEPFKESPEVTSKAMDGNGDVEDGMRKLREKLSAALVNVSAKDDLVKQHSKVAEEAVAGWEKAENEVVALKQQVEDAAQRNSALEDRLSHVDGALKECVRQLRQARDEQEQKIAKAVLKKTSEWEVIKSELEAQLLEFQANKQPAISEANSHVDPDLFHRLESLERENSALKLEIRSQYEEIEIMTIERDLSVEAAETASKQHLESIKKVAKLESECRRLKFTACKSSSMNDHKSTAASSIYVDSITDGQSDSCSDSGNFAQITDIDHFTNEKTMSRNITASSIEIDLMDDFLEMERLAALPVSENKSPSPEPEAPNKRTDEETYLRAELEAMTRQVAELEEKLQNVVAEKANLLDAMSLRASDLEENLQRVVAENAELEENLQKAEAEKVELEESLQKVDAEKAELDITLNESQESVEKLQLKLTEAEMKLEALQREIHTVNESKQSIQSRLISMEAESRTMSAKVDTLETELQRERAMSEENALKCLGLEEELARKRQETIAYSNGERKMKQDELSLAAGKLAECQKTIASLGNQLKSLATLEDFLIDPTSLPGVSGRESLSSGENVQWRLHSNETFSPRRGSTASRIASESSVTSINKNDKNSPPSSSLSASSQVCSDKNRNGFAKFFTRSKSGIHLEI